MAPFDRFCQCLTVTKCAKYQSNTLHFTYGIIIPRLYLMSLLMDSLAEFCNDIRYEKTRTVCYQAVKSDNMLSHSDRLGDRQTELSSTSFLSCISTAMLTHDIDTRIMSVCLTCYQEENHVINWEKAKVVDRGTTTGQMDKRGTLDEEDTVVHESGCRILPTQPHMEPGNFQVTRSIKL